VAGAAAAQARRERARERRGFALERAGRLRAARRCANKNVPRRAAGPPVRAPPPPGARPIVGWAGFRGDRGAGLARGAVQASSGETLAIWGRLRGGAAGF
jgi:hypothetical protein